MMLVMHPGRAVLIPSEILREQSNPSCDDRRSSPEPRAPVPEPRSSSYNQSMRISIAAVALLFVSCSTSAQPIKPQTASDVVATVGATSITLAQVDELALQQPASSF